MLSECSGASWGCEPESDNGLDSSGEHCHFFVFLVLIGADASHGAGQKKLLSEGLESVCVPPDEQPDSYHGFLYDRHLPDAVSDYRGSLLRGERESVSDGRA